MSSTSEKKDYSSILVGLGENDYVKYMKTDTLLSLQRNPDEWLHRHELLFQIIHQSTELWLKLSCSGLEEALKSIEAGNLDSAIPMIHQSSQCVKLITDQLDILTNMTPWDFQKIRPALGNGSGLESPGWQNVQQYGKSLSTAIDRYIKANNIDLVDIYTSGEYSTVFNLSEALINWDEHVSLWRTRHYKIAVRIIGHNTVGTKGMPVDKLANLLNHKYFPQLWELRSQISSLSEPINIY